MILEILSKTTGGDYINLINYFSNDTFEASEEDVSGPNEASTMDGKFHRDKIGQKKNFSLTTRAIGNDEAKRIEALIREETIELQSDYFSGSEENPAIYEVYCASRQKVFVHMKDGVEYVRLSFSLLEV